MKTIGLLGGLSWESTLSYYQIINETVQEQLGGLHSAKLLLCSVDFAEVERWQAAGDWDKCAALLGDAARRLERAGADFIVLCTNTLHKVAPEIRAQISIPLLHIAEVSAGAIKEAGLSAVGLLGTRYTLHQDFYTDVLAQAGLQVLLPAEEAVDAVDAIIFDELCRGIVREASLELLLRQIETFRARGAQGVLLGCTELGLLVKPGDAALPLFDSALLHARAAALAALSNAPDGG